MMTRSSVSMHDIVIQITIIIIICLVLLLLDPSLLPPTPNYNNAVAEDMSASLQHRLIIAAMQSCPAARDVLILLKVSPRKDICNQIVLSYCLCCLRCGCLSECVQVQEMQVS